MNKRDARKLGLARRDALLPSIKKEKEKRIYDQLIPLIDKYTCIGCYLSMRSEVDTYPLIQYCLDMHKAICVPIIKEKKLYFMTLDSLSHLHDAPFHTKEPNQGTIIEPENIDLMIVPLSSFDEMNNRTGYGKGYYDSVLNRCTCKVGIAFEEQKVDHIETDPWDVQLDTVICA